MAMWERSLPERMLANPIVHWLVWPGRRLTCLLLGHRPKYMHGKKCKRCGATRGGKDG